MVNGSTACKFLLMTRRRYSIHKYPISSSLACLVFTRLLFTLFLRLFKIKLLSKILMGLLRHDATDGTDINCQNKTKPYFAVEVGITASIIHGKAQS